jgi:ADP-heptose:LPS heptosyltransferase
VLLNANAGDLLPQRRWAGHNYVLLAQRLLCRWPGALVLFTGSACEARACENLVKAVDSSRCHSIAGRTSLPELLTLYMMADVLVTNDSGPAHFAALTDINVVTLFGPETPALFGAQTLRNHVLWSRLPCSPCVNAFNQRQTSCQNNLCMQSISVDQVYLKVLGLCQRKILIPND